jgi:hypothetical protein
MDLATVYFNYPSIYEKGKTLLHTSISTTTDMYATPTTKMALNYSSA